ncbi:MAG: ferritin-like domain-containing protein [Variovorax sp.]
MANGASPRWRIDDLDFSSVDIDSARGNETLFYLAACASFIESGSDLYTDNLTDYFRDDPEVFDWLRGQWEPEELQHGKALRSYVEHVWPEFEWSRAYRSFLAEYANYCKVELLAPTQALELAARCVVETGTATYYTALARSSTEPVLRNLAARIAADEVNHYKHFLRFFRRYRAAEALGRARVLTTLGRRTLELRSEDADCAIRHVARVRRPARANDKRYVRGVGAEMRAAVRRNLQAGTTLKMLIRPLELPARMESVVQYPIEKFMNSVFLR